MTIQQDIKTHIQSLGLLDVSISTSAIQDPEEEDLEGLYIAVLPTTRSIAPRTRGLIQEVLNVSLVGSKRIGTEKELNPEDIEVEVAKETETQNQLDKMITIADSFLGIELGEYSVTKVDIPSFIDYQMLAERNIFQSEVVIELTRHAQI